MAKRELAIWLCGLILWGLLRGLLPLLPVPLPLFPIAWLIALVGGVTLLVWLAFEAGRVLEPKWSTPVGLILFAVRVGLAFLSTPENFVVRVAFFTIAETITLAAALLLGSSISGFIRYANLIPPIAVVLTVVDIWTVWLGGFVARIQQKAQEGVAIAQKVVEAATVKMPTIATAHHARVGIPVIGIGDLFFGAFLFALLWRFGLNARGAFILSVVFVILGLMLAQLPFVPYGVPGLPFIAMAILLPNLKAFRYTPEEKKSLAVGVLFLFMLLAFFSIMVSRL